MKTIYRFLVKPKEERYDNKIKVGDKELVTNTRIETFQSVSKRAIVEIVPEYFKTDIRPGDEIIIHHNVFRRFYDMKGKEKNSASFFNCFVHPILSTDDFSTFKEQSNLGILKYGNSSLEAKGITPGALITFTPNSEFEFIIDSDRLYCMKSNDIALTHEYQEDKVKHNPSWAKSS